MKIYTLKSLVETSRLKLVKTFTEIDNTVHNIGFILLLTLLGFCGQFIWEDKPKTL